MKTASHLTAAVHLLLVAAVFVLMHPAAKATAASDDTGSRSLLGAPIASKPAEVSAQNNNQIGAGLFLPEGRVKTTPTTTLVRGRKLAGGRRWSTAPEVPIVAHDDTAAGDVLSESKVKSTIPVAATGRRLSGTSESLVRSLDGRTWSDTEGRDDPVSVGLILSEGRATGALITLAPTARGRKLLGSAALGRAWTDAINPNDATSAAAGLVLSEGRVTKGPWAAAVAAKPAGPRHLA